MKILLALPLGVLLLSGCGAEKSADAPAAPATTESAVPTESAVSTESAIPTESAVPTATNESGGDPGTWAGQLKVAQPVSTLNYVGEESGDWVPMRFRNDSEAGKKILAACSNDDLCEFTGAVEWLDEAPPPDASAIAQIVRVERVKRLPAE